MAQGLVLGHQTAPRKTQCVTPSVPWAGDGDRDRDRDRPERAAAVGAQALLRACTAILFFPLEEEKSKERDGKLKRDGVLGSLSDYM